MEIEDAGAVRAGRGRIEAHGEVGDLAAALENGDPLHGGSGL
jgi:hypothetical protein